jgi:hypothetical protein
MPDQELNMENVQKLTDSLAQRIGILSEDLLTFLEAECLKKNYLGVELLVALTFTRAKLETAFSQEELKRIYQSFQIVDMKNINGFA